MKVSVVIPAYNHEKYIAETIASVLAQTYEFFELIIVNDGSTDKTEDVVCSFDDRRIKYYRQDNQGAHVALNKGIDIASGQYLTILNSDDIYLPDRIKQCVEFLDNNEAYSTVISKVSGINEGSLPVSKRDSVHIKAWLDWYEKALTFFENDQFMPNLFSKNILITTSNYFIRKSVLDKIGGFIPLRYAHDWDMLLRISGETKIHLMDEVLLKYRIHSANTVLEVNSEARVKFEVNWLVAENIKYLFSANIDVQGFSALLKENHYVSPDVLMFILAYTKNHPSLSLLDFDHPVTKRIVHSLS